MFTPLFESIPCSDTGEIRSQFERYGHVSINGLIDPASLEPALHNVGRLSSGRTTHNYGNRETVTKLRKPDPAKEKGLHAIVRGVQEGAVLLGHDIVPPTQAYLLELKEMEPNTQGPYQGYPVTFAGAIATARLQGVAYRTVKASGAKQGVDYFMRPGDVIIEDAGRNLEHRSYTGSDIRVELTVAANPMLPRHNAA